MKLKGLKKAIGEYKRANADGIYSPRYGNLMLDKSTGEIWCDWHYDLGRGEYTLYHSTDIIDLAAEMSIAINYGTFPELPINMQTVKMFCAENYGITH